jgi:thioredoxin-like negative regulator of GroEL
VCEPLEAKLKELSEELKIPLEVLPIEREPTRASQLLVFSAPTLILEESGREIKRWSGAFSILEVKGFVERIRERLG